MTAKFFMACLLPSAPPANRAPPHPHAALAACKFPPASSGSRRLAPSRRYFDISPQRGRFLLAPKIFVLVLRHSLPLQNAPKIFALVLVLRCSLLPPYRSKAARYRLAV